MSSKSTSHIDPRETTLEKPIPRVRAQSMTEVATAPDCVTKAISPCERRDVSETRVHAGMRRHDAEAVRADDAQQRRFRRVEHGLHQGLAFGALALTEAGCDDDGGTTAAPAELGDDARYSPGRRRDHCEIRVEGQVAYGTIVEGRADSALVRVHRQDRPCEAAFEQVPGQHGPDRPWLVAGADQCDRGGREQCIEIADRQRGLQAAIGCRSIPVSANLGSIPDRARSAFVFHNADSNPHRLRKNAPQLEQASFPRSLEASLQFLADH